MLSILYGTAASLGAGRRYRNVDGARVRRLVFVCKGNICRSAFAQAMATKHGLAAKSMGVDADNGVPAAQTAIAAARAFGVDLSSHRATHCSEFRLAYDDLVVGFEPFHIARVMATMPASGTKPACQYTLLGAWERPPNLYIHDPYGSSTEYFAACFGRIERAILRVQLALDLHRGDG